MDFTMIAIAIGSLLAVVGLVTAIVRIENRVPRTIARELLLTVCLLALIAAVATGAGAAISALRLV